MTAPSSRKTTRKSRDPVRTKATILRAAREEFERKGLSGARTNTIAKRAEVPQGLIYHYFEGKTELFRAVLEDAMEGYFVSTIEMLMAGAEEPSLALIERAIRLHFDFLRQHPHVPRLLAWWQADRGWQEGSILSIEKAHLCERPYELGSQRIREGQAAGLIRPELDPILVISSFIGLSMEWHINEEMHCAEHGVRPDDGDAVRKLQDQALDHIVELVLNGVATKSTDPKPEEIRS
jgi:AcrR family transcriptional regulator